MMELLLTGLVMGLLGSFHCVGMCGPLALSVPINATGKWARIVSSLCYSFGRATTYFLIGLILGWTGSRMVMVGYQQIFSIVAGALIILFLAAGKYLPHANLFPSLQTQLKLQLAGFLKKKNNVAGVYLFGLLNGLLPCGLVYMAVASALVIGDAWQSGVFMAAFGLGTLPLMTVLILSGRFISFSIRSKMKRAVPVFIVIVACLMILRGLNLGIPYVSPAFSAQKKATHCAP